ncbi:hypothetical protein [Cohnella abietis]|uniref:GerMN domain-containing protein n=1 Tax=Cohnella abietis TaxID=2507935 RepID=A0A3T1DF79_9BACL|nr:hypothetical protein [Cohnella abietis]BBI36684.1 hypothetical protein KCTCHS21_60830 [Cohnella abietis]
MKRAWVLVIIIVLLATGCSSKNGEESSNTGANNNVEASNSPETSGSTGEDEVDLVFPASLNSSGDVEGMTSEVKEAGATNVVENSDGSATVTISRANLDKLLEKYHSEILTVIKDLHTDNSSTPIKDLTYDEGTFQEFSLTVDKAAYESAESTAGLIVFGLAMQSLMYQVYSGVAEADIKVTFKLIDESTGEVFDTIVLPEATPAQ